MFPLNKQFLSCIFLLCYSSAMLILLPRKEDLLQTSSLLSLAWLYFQGSSRHPNGPLIQ